MYTKRQKKVGPLHIFFTGKGGCGKIPFNKNNLSKSITKTLLRNLELCSFHQAINIGRTTIHSALGIPVGNFSSTVPKLGDKMKSSL